MRGSQWGVLVSQNGGGIAPSVWKAPKMVQKKVWNPDCCNKWSKTIALARCFAPFWCREPLGSCNIICTTMVRIAKPEILHHCLYHSGAKTWFFLLQQARFCIMLVHQEERSFHRHSHQRVLQMFWFVASMNYCTTAAYTKNEYKYMIFGTWFGALDVANRIARFDTYLKSEKLSKALTAIRTVFGLAIRSVLFGDFFSGCVVFI